MSENASAPALPRLACAATPSRSISSTSRPSRCRRNAIATPTMPAPITSTSVERSVAAGACSGDAPTLTVASSQPPRERIRGVEHEAGVERDEARGRESGAAPRSRERPEAIRAAARSGP